MIDTRVSLYLQAAEALRKEHFDVSIPVGEPDEVSELGEALEALAQTLKVKSAQSKMLAQIQRATRPRFIPSRDSMPTPW